MILDVISSCVVHESRGGWRAPGAWTPNSGDTDLRPEPPAPRGGKEILWSRINCTDIAQR
jgi:hypothetical protein